MRESEKELEPGTIIKEIHYARHLGLDVVKQDLK
jgi:hypothetical protein